jgi:hypothetical protein
VTAAAVFQPTPDGRQQALEFDRMRRQEWRSINCGSGSAVVTCCPPRESLTKDFELCVYRSSRRLVALLRQCAAPGMNPGPLSASTRKDKAFSSSYRGLSLVLSLFHRNTVQFPTTLSLNSAPFQGPKRKCSRPTKLSLQRNTTLRAIIHAKSQPPKRTFTVN